MQFRWYQCEGGGGGRGRDDFCTHLSRHCHKSEHYTKTNHTTITMADQTVPTTEAGMKMECRGDMSEGNGEGDGEESDGDDSGEDGEEAVG